MNSLYIYESHMGGLYTSIEKLPYEQLYCDECGDSDSLIGIASNAEEAWELLKDNTATFDTRICDSCEHCDDFDYCDEHCEEIKHSGGYSLSHVMDFLYENFSDSSHINKIYLLGYVPGQPNLYLANCQPSGCKFGEKHIIPSAYCMREEFVDMIANNLCVCKMRDADIETAHCVFKKRYEDMTVYIYTCGEILNDIEKLTEAAYYGGDGWYGYFKKDLIEFPDHIKDYFEKEKK